MKNTEVLIIGGGLTGLATAYFLEQKGITATIIEARIRLGGRIHTVSTENTPPQEMGATWLGRQHTALIALLEELNIEIFEQILGDNAVYEPISTSPPQLVTLPPNSDPSFRIKGGTSTLIRQLSATLNSDQIHLGQTVQSITKTDNGFIVKTDSTEYHRPKVISTLPPFLLKKTVEFYPSLPNDLLEIAEQTHTWMGESIKVSLAYKIPFWRADHLSGTIFSNVGPIPEMYDHSDADNKYFALTGFFNGAYFSVTKAERLEMVLTQLQKYFGDQVRDYLTYEEVVWRNENLTFTPYSGHVLPHQNNGNPIFRTPFFDGNFFVAGSEIAIKNPGYMEGAIQSALFVSQAITNKLT